MQIGDQLRSTVESFQDLVGYRAQLERARRLRARLYIEPDWGEDRSTEFQDDMLSTFQAIWHVKDWVRNDPILCTAQYVAQRDAIVAAAEASPILNVCQDICNGTKHFKLTSPRSGTTGGAKVKHLSHTRVSGFTVEMDCVVETGLQDVNGNPEVRSGKELTAEGIKEWERILTVNNLPITPR
jgi:hypothetical protein